MPEDIGDCFGCAVIEGRRVRAGYLVVADDGTVRPTCMLHRGWIAIDEGASA